MVVLIGVPTKRRASCVNCGQPIHETAWEGGRVEWSHDYDTESGHPQFCWVGPIAAPKVGTVTGNAT